MKFTLTFVAASLLTTIIAAPVTNANLAILQREKATDFGEYTVEAKREAVPEKATDYAEYTVEGKREAEPEQAPDLNYTVGP